MHRIKAVGFDLDGTLFDHRGSAAAALDTFLVGLGVEPTPRTQKIWLDAEEVHLELWRTGRITFQDQRRARLRTVLPQLEVPVPSTEADLDSLFGRYLTAYRAAWRPFQDSSDVLIGLRAAGMKLGILTNGTEQQQSDKLRQIGLDSLVDVVCISESLGVQKPDTGAFRALACRLGVVPAECLFVGDNPEQDIAGAAAIGMPSLLVDRYGTDHSGIAARIWRITNVR